MMCGSLLRSSPGVSGSTHGFPERPQRERCHTAPAGCASWVRAVCAAPCCMHQWGSRCNLRDPGQCSPCWDTSSATKNHRIVEKWNAASSVPDPALSVNRDSCFCEQTGLGPPHPPLQLGTAPALSQLPRKAAQHAGKVKMFFLTGQLAKKRWLAAAT